MTYDLLINPALPFPCVPTVSMGKNTSKKKLNVNVWILFHTVILEDVMPEKDNFLNFPLTDCKSELGTSATILFLSLPTVTLLETCVLS